MQRVQPAHLVDELVAVRCLAVRKVAADDAHARHGSGDHARLLVGKAGDVLLDGLGGDFTADERDAVVGLLPEPLRLVASFEVRAPLAPGTCRRSTWSPARPGRPRVGCQPFHDLRQAHGQRIDVPGGEVHGRDAGPVCEVGDSRAMCGLGRRIVLSTMCIMLNSKRPAGVAILMRVAVSVVWLLSCWLDNVIPVPMSSGGAA